MLFSFAPAADQFLCHGVQDTCTHGKDQITGAGQVIQPVGEDFQGWGRLGTGDHLGQVLGGNANLVLLSGGKNFCQEDLVRTLKDLGKLIKSAWVRV